MSLNCAPVWIFLIAPSAQLCGINSDSLCINGGIAEIDQKQPPSIQVGVTIKVERLLADPLELEHTTIKSPIATATVPKLINITSNTIAGI